MMGMVMSGNRSTDRRLTETSPRTMLIKDSIRMKTGFFRARRVSHMALDLSVGLAWLRLARAFASDCLAGFSHLLNTDFARGRGPGGFWRSLLAAERIDVTRDAHAGAIGE